MRSPKNMQIIELDITNACINRCSNCTRFCGHHETPFFMDFPTFKQAVDSLEGFPGMIGIIGGEPTIHPQFEQFCDYIRHVTGKTLTLSRFPVHNMVQYMFDNLNDLKHSNFGLFTALGQKYYSHYESINETFPFQLLNDHQNVCQHQALLMARKELGISDEEWIAKRDACWIQNTWSASITPKGAFFCEIAASLDMLFKGPGGWKVEKDWWKREPKDFTDQLHWCELCSAALDVPKRLSNDTVDDITPLLLEKLKEVHSPKIQKGDYVLLDTTQYSPDKYNGFHSADEYMKSDEVHRTSDNNRSMYPKKFDHCNYETMADFIKTKKPTDWVVVSPNKSNVTSLTTKLANLVINPGCLYYYHNTIFFNVLSKSIRNCVLNGDTIDRDTLESLYPEDKKIHLSYAHFHPKFYYVYEKGVRFVSHVTTILVPNSKMRKKIRKRIENRLLKGRQ